MTFEEIKELIGLVLDTGIAELEVGRGEDRVRIRRSTEPPAREVILPAAAHAGHHVPAPVGPRVETAATAGGLSHAGAPAEPDEGLEYVKSPIVGTFYESPSPDAASFVNVGDRIKPGNVLCIIESMKLMNEIESEVSGTIIRKLVENGRPVEYGEALFAVRLD